MCRVSQPNYVYVYVYEGKEEQYCVVRDMKAKKYVQSIVYPASLLKTNYLQQNNIYDSRSTHPTPITRPSFTNGV